MVIDVVDGEFGPASRNRLAEIARPDRRGALAALETFYFAVHHRDLGALSAVLSQHELVQVDDPVGGVVRSAAAVTGLHRRILAGGLGLTVTLVDAVAYAGDGVVVFAGREIGRYRERDGCTVALTIRTTRAFGYCRDAGCWQQLHHHGSIDEAGELAAYQRAVGSWCGAGPTIS
ncbi:YybH family protein [Pseudonocardia sp. GCM10023141]|uniref:YybH family protein n=1 Tax=Pseudonocardia sp. GCM10023141 TaxID=3252653 RepID=UPI003609A8CC